MNDHTATTWLRITIASVLAAAMGIVLGTSSPAVAVDLGPANGFTTTRTSMELEDDPLAEGNKVVDGTYGPTSFDWDSILPEFDGTGRGPYLTTAAAGITSKQSLGVIDTSFGYDVADQTADLEDQALEACTGDDPSGLPGSQTVATFPLDIDAQNNINNKGDLCSGGAAVEVIEENGQYRYVLYQYWTRQPITGGNSGEFNIFQILEGPEPGRCDDLAIWFDYSSSSQVVQNISVLEWSSTDCFNGGGDAWTASSLDVNAYAGNTGKNPDLDPARAPQPDDNFGSFGESAVDLTAAGVIPTDECATFTLAGFVSSTSNNGNPNGQQLLDIFSYPEPIVIDTCANVRIDKETQPGVPNPAADFDYAIDPANSANPNSYTGTLTVPGAASDLRTDVVASPGYELTETGADPVWTNTLASCQALDPVTRTWQVYSYLPGDESPVPFPVAPSVVLDGAPDPLPATATIPAVNPGETAACKLVNETAGIVVAKETLPDGATTAFPFTITGTGVDTGADLADGESQFFAIPEGTVVTITEGTPDPNATPEFVLDDVSCVDSSGGSVGSASGDDGVTVTVGDVDDVITCTFTNVQQGRIVVAKAITAGSAVGDSLLETFDFRLTGDFATDETFTLDGNGDDTDGTVSTESFDVRPGAYSVDETVPSDWNLDDVVCSGGQDPTDLTVAPGATVTCTFSNSPDPADVTIRKSVDDVAADYPWSFDFTIAPDPDGDGGQDATKPAAGTGPTSVSIGWTGLVPGQQYTISEAVPAGWSQSGLTCLGLDDLDQDANDASVTFVAEPGQSLSCSVTNTPDDPTITIVKTTVGGTGSFDFRVTPESDEDTLVEETITTQADGVAVPGATHPLLTGLTYAVDELDPGTSWAEGALDCGAFGTAAPGAAVDVTGGPGDQIICEITNSALGNITVIKSTEGGDGTFGFEIGGEPFSITTDGGAGQEDFLNLQPGEYVITETDPTSDFDGTRLSCTSSNGDEEIVDLADLTATVDLSNGETVVCTFTNTERAHIVVDKVTDPSGDPTRFTFTENWTPDTGGSFQLADGDTPRDSGPIPSNTTYTLVEAPTADWVVTGFVCVGGTNDVVYDVDPNDADGASARITPAPGETILCTVTNSLRGPVTITKVADPTGVTRSGDVYTVSYDLTVGTESYITEAFTLTDTPAFAGGTTIVDITVTDESAAEVVLPLNGSIDPGDTLVYTVSIDFTIDGALSLADRDCAGTGTATFNSATVTYAVDPGSSTDVDCVDLPDPDLTITKIVSDGQPVHVADNVYTAEYTITVDNVGDGPGAYDLVDTPDFGAGATVTNVTVSGNGVSVDQDGGGPVTIITGETIGADEPPHVYTVTVTFEVAGSMTSDARTCVDGEDRAGSGAFNGAVVTFNGDRTAEDDDCVDIPEPDVSIVKSLDTANPLTRDADGSWTIGYLLTVSNAADAGPADYDLTDTFDFPAGVTVDGVAVSVVGSDPAGSVLASGFDGDAQPIIATGVRIDDGETHVYRVVVDLSIEVVPGIDGDCAGDGGLVNTMAVSVRGSEPLTDDACDSFSTLTLVKTVVNDDGGGSAVPGDFTLNATGPTTISGAGTVAEAVPAGTYQLGEAPVSGYRLSSLTCDNATGQVTSALVADGANVTCTFVNDDEPVADLAIVKTASTALTGPGNSFTWTLVVTNNGPGTAADVEVGDLVPSSLTVNGVASSFFSCSRSGNDVTCTRPSMAVGASGTITISVTVDAPASDGAIVNVGTVEASTPDPDLTNNSDDASVDVVIPLPPTVIPPPATLPPTGGGSTDPLTRSALGLVLLGGTVLLITRRRREDGTTG